MDITPALKLEIKQLLIENLMLQLTREEIGDTQPLFGPQSVGLESVDALQVVVALVITPDGFPLAYEVLAGNTADKTTLRGFLQRIEQQYGQAARIWLKKNKPNLIF